MSTPILGGSADLLPMVRPTAVLMLRTPVPPSTGSDPWHDQFGPYCLPSFPLSALESGSSTPLPPAYTPLSGGQQMGAEVLRSALQSSATGRRRGRWISEDDSLTTTHLAKDEEDGEREWCVTSIPVLGHRIVDSPALAARIQGGTPSSGVVVTSQRAVDAWSQAANAIAAVEPEGISASTLKWPKIPFFAVGPATSTALRQLGPTLPHYLRPSLVMGGGATGTGDALAAYVVRHFAGREEGTSEAPVLILTGDKNAPTIPDTLRAAGISCEVLQVYETCEDPSFDSRCDVLSHTLPAASSRPGSRRTSRAGSSSSTRRPSFSSWATTGGNCSASAITEGSTAASALGSIGTMSGGMPWSAMTPFASAGSTARAGSPQPLRPAGGTGEAVEDDDAPPLPLASDIGLGTGSGAKPDWLVYFSPSGLQYSLESLRFRRWLPPGSLTPTADGQLRVGAPEGYPRIAVLGPTTKRAVREVLGFAPDAVAAMPEPVELREAIRGAEARIRRERERASAAAAAKQQETDVVQMDTSG